MPIFGSSIKTKQLDSNIGPLETMRVVFDRTMHYKVYYFAELIDTEAPVSINSAKKYTL